MRYGVDGATVLSHYRRWRGDATDRLSRGERKLRHSAARDASWLLDYAVDTRGGSGLMGSVLQVIVEVCAATAEGLFGQARLSRTSWGGHRNNQ